MLRRRLAWVTVAAAVSGLLIGAILIAVSRPAPPPGTQVAPDVAMVDDGLPWPFRGEPLIAAGEVPLERMGDGWDAPFALRDPVGDVGTGDATPWLDLTMIEIQALSSAPEGTGMAATFHLAGPALRPVPGSNELWLGYGYVVDTNGDGRADYRVGMDNAGEFRHREWITDLATGGTTMNQGGSYGLAAEEVFIDTYFPRRLDRGRIIVGVDHPPPLRFYVWASVIGKNGESITDYAPDVGWIAYRPVPMQ